ncbi:MAG: hypothetical protein JSV54_04060, partial [Chloroflexota bacterium]
MEAGKPPITIKRTWKPLAAGALDIIFSIISAIFSVGFLGVASCATNLGDTSSSKFLGGIAVVLLAIAFLACAGGISAIKRRRWWLAVTGSIVALFPSLLPFILLMQFPARLLPYLIVV